MLEHGGVHEPPRIESHLGPISSTSLGMSSWDFHSHGGTPYKWMVYFMENPMKMDDN